MSKKEQLAKKVKAVNKGLTDEQAIQIANFLISLSEVFYEVESKSNDKNQAA